jgi:hypothetical protein
MSEKNVLGEGLCVHSMGHNPRLGQPATTFPSHLTQSDDDHGGSAAVAPAF